MKNKERLSICIFCEKVVNKYCKKDTRTSTWSFRTIGPSALLSYLYRGINSFYPAPFTTHGWCLFNLNYQLIPGVLTSYLALAWNPLMSHWSQYYENDDSRIVLIYGIVFPLRGKQVETPDLVYDMQLRVNNSLNWNFRRVGSKMARMA